MSDAFKKVFPRAYFSRLVEQDLRSDGRTPLDVRKTRVVKGPISTADSSSLCTVGRTSVLCGVRYEVGPPQANKPTSGRIEIKLELSGICSPNPNEGFSIRMEQALRRLVDAGLVDLEDLCIQERKAVWVLKCHLICLDDDGNLFDACVLAFASAIKELKLPSDIIMGEDGIVRELSNKKDKALKLRFSPVSLTFGIFDEGRVIVADPNADEELVLEGLIHVIMDISTGDCISVLKPGGSALSMERLNGCFDLCQARKVIVQGSA